MPIKLDDSMTTTDSYTPPNTAFSEIYAIYFPRMTRFARTYLIDKAEAENVVQDIFIYGKTACH